MSKDTYVLIELGQEGPRFRGESSGPFDSWICKLADMTDKVKEIVDVVEAGESIEMKFTVMEMTETEFRDYCEQHDIEWYE